MKVKSVKQYCESEIGKAVLLFACLIDCYLELLGTRARREDSSSTERCGHCYDCVFVDLFLWVALSSPLIFVYAFYKNTRIYGIKNCVK